MMNPHVVLNGTIKPRKRLNGLGETGESVNQFAEWATSEEGKKVWAKIIEFLPKLFGKLKCLGASTNIADKKAGLIKDLASLESSVNNTADFKQKILNAKARDQYHLDRSKSPCSKEANAFGVELFNGLFYAVESAPKEAHLGLLKSFALGIQNNGTLPNLPKTSASNTNTIIQDGNATQAGFLGTIPKSLQTILFVGVAGGLLYALNKKPKPQKAKA